MNISVIFCRKTLLMISFLVILKLLVFFFHSCTTPNLSTPMLDPRLLLMLPFYTHLLISNTSNSVVLRHHPWIFFRHTRHPCSIHTVLVSIQHFYQETLCAIRRSTQNMISDESILTKFIDSLPRFLSNTPPLCLIQYSRRGKIF